MTTQTPDAVREPVDPRVEIGAKALGLHRIPGGEGRYNPPTRWPTGPQDTLSGRDGTVPLTWDFAEQCRADVRAILSALDSRAGDAGEEIENGYTADDAVDFVFNRLASKLGLVDWRVVEGSEEWEGDVSATLHRLLIDAGIIDDETGAVATLATPAPAVDAVPAGEVGLRQALGDAINSPKGVVPVSAEPFYDGRAGRVKPAEATPTAYLMTGRWELDPEGRSPGIYMDDPEGGDPLCLCVVRRV